MDDAHSDNGTAVAEAPHHAARISPTNRLKPFDRPADVRISLSDGERGPAVSQEEIKTAAQRAHTLLSWGLGDRLNGNAGQKDGMIDRQITERRRNELSHGIVEEAFEKAREATGQIVQGGNITDALRLLGDYRNGSSPVGVIASVTAQLNNAASSPKEGQPASPDIQDLRNLSNDLGRLANIAVQMGLVHSPNTVGF